MRLLITPNGVLLNLDNIIAFEYENMSVIARTANQNYFLFKFDSESSGKSWILNDFVSLIEKDTNKIDLRKIKL